MGKLNGRYKLDQAIGIIKFIDLSGLVRVGYYENNPAILVGYNTIEELPDEFIKVNLCNLMDEEFEIYSHNKLNDASEELMTILDEAKQYLPKDEFERIRIEFIDPNPNCDRPKPLVDWSGIIHNGEDKYLIYSSTLAYLYKDTNTCHKIKILGKDEQPMRFR